MNLLLTLCANRLLFIFVCLFFFCCCFIATELFVIGHCHFIFTPQFEQLLTLSLALLGSRNRTSRFLRCSRCSRCRCCCTTTSRCRCYRPSCQPCTLRLLWFHWCRFLHFITKKKNKHTQTTSWR